MDDPNRLIRIEDKVDQVVDRLHAMDVTLASQAVTLEDHVRRSTMLERQMVPIKRHVNMMEGALKLLGILAVLFELYKAIK